MLPASSALDWPFRNFAPRTAVPVLSLSSHLMQRKLHLPVAALVVLLAACHAGNKVAKELRESCDTGNAAACNQLAVPVQKGQYVLRDVQ